MIFKDVQKSKRFFDNPVNVGGDFYVLKDNKEEFTDPNSKFTL